MAGNQLGKTLAGGFEAAMHATGRYPEWWAGRRFDKPVVGWVCGVTGEVVRDTVQKVLIGRPGQEGTGATVYVSRTQHGQAFWVSVWVGDVVDHQIVLVEIPAPKLQKKPVFESS